MKWVSILSSILITSLFTTVYHNLYLNYHVDVILTNSLSVLSKDGLTIFFTSPIPHLDVIKCPRFKERDPYIWQKRALHVEINTKMWGSYTIRQAKCWWEAGNYADQKWANTDKGMCLCIYWLMQFYFWTFSIKKLRWMQLLIIYYTYREQLVNCPTEKGTPSKSSWSFMAGCLCFCYFQTW